MNARYRGDAKTLADMLEQGLAGIASFLACTALTGEECRKYLKQAFPNAFGSSVNAAYRWIVDARNAAKRVNNDQSLPVQSEIPRNPKIPAGNKYRYTVLVEVNDFDIDDMLGGSVTPRRYQTIIDSPGALTLEGILDLINRRRMEQADRLREYERKGPNIVTEIVSAKILTVERR